MSQNYEYINKVLYSLMKANLKCVRPTKTTSFTQAAFSNTVFTTYTFLTSRPCWDCWKWCVNLFRSKFSPIPLSQFIDFITSFSNFSFVVFITYYSYIVYIIFAIRRWKESQIFVQSLNKNGYFIKYRDDTTTTRPAPSSSRCALPTTR